MRRRDFLKLLGWVPVVALAAAMGWRKELSVADIDRAVSDAHELDYLTSDTAWFLTKKDRDRYTSQIGPWSVKQSDGTYVTVTTRAWDPKGLDKYGANQPTL